MGKQLNKLKLAVPVTQVMQTQPDLLRLMTSKTNLLSFKAGRVVHVARGTKVKVLDLEHLEAEVAALEASPVDSGEKLERKLKAVGKKFERRGTQDVQLMVKEDSVAPNAGGNVGTGLPPAIPTSVVPVPRGRERVTWADPHSINVRGRVDPGDCHFLAVCTINGVSTDVVVDTGGARTMMDLNTAVLMGLDVEQVPLEKQRGLEYYPFGYYVGPGGLPVPYAGRIRGPFGIKFSPRVEMTFPEMRVIAANDPLILIGTDVMKNLNRGSWRFLNVGYHPVSDIGLMQFHLNEGKEVEAVEMVKVPPPKELYGLVAGDLVGMTRAVSGGEPHADVLSVGEMVEALSDATALLRASVSRLDAGDVEACLQGVRGREGTSSRAGAAGEKLTRSELLASMANCSISDEVRPLARGQRLC